MFKRALELLEWTRETKRCSYMNMTPQQSQASPKPNITQVNTFLNEIITLLIYVKLMYMVSIQDK